MSVTRRWYSYNCAPGGQFNAANYNYVQNFPNNCVMCAENICVVLGVYSMIVGGVTTIFGTHPRTLAADPRLDSYVADALATGCATPSGFGQRRFVYMKDC